MEHHGSVVRLLAFAVVLATLLGLCSGASDKHQRKIIIHVPYYIKNHHHTHTVYKYIKGHKDHHDDAESVGQGGGGGGTASLEQEHVHQGEDGGGSGEAAAAAAAAAELHADNFHHHHHHEEATQDTPLALGLHGEPPHPQDNLPLHQAHQDDEYGGGHRHDHGGDDHHHHHHHHQEQQRVRELGAHIHHEERSRHHQQHGHHHHHHHNLNDGGDGREHAHFHTKFVVSSDDGQLRETDSSESSEQSGHGALEPHKDRIPYTNPREQEYHNRYEHTDHRHFGSQEGEQKEDFNQEENYNGNQPQHEDYNTLQTEQRTDESQHFFDPSLLKDHAESYTRFHHETFEDKFVPKDNRVQKKSRGKRVEERSRRHRYEVEEPDQDSAPKRTTRTSHDHSLYYQRPERKKHNFNWR